MDSGLSPGSEKDLPQWSVVQALPMGARFPRLFRVNRNEEETDVQWHYFATWLRNFGVFTCNYSTSVLIGGSLRVASPLKKRLSSQINKDVSPPKPSLLGPRARLNWAVRSDISASARPLSKASLNRLSRPFLLENPSGVNPIIRAICLCVTSLADNS